MSKKNPGRIDCACVIHGSGYDWQYVERLYNMLCRNLLKEVRLHVYTEHDRSVPPHMVKHILEDWGISGPKRSWWYKMQLFNPTHFAGNMLQLKGSGSESYLVMSQSALNSLRPAQIKLIKSHTTIVSSPLETIETLGGGSARCMMAEVFLPLNPSI